MLVKNYVLDLKNSYIIIIIKIIIIIIIIHDIMAHTCSGSITPLILTLGC
jgi:hypothetical protein